MLRENSKLLKVCVDYVKEGLHLEIPLIFEALNCIVVHNVDVLFYLHKSISGHCLLDQVTSKIFID